MSIVEIKRPKGAEATEIEQYLEAILEIALWRRGNWKEEVVSRMVHTLGLLEGLSLGSSGTRTIEGGQYKVTLETRS